MIDITTTISLAAAVGAFTCLSIMVYSILIKEPDSTEEGIRKATFCIKLCIVSLILGITALCLKLIGV